MLRGVILWNCRKRKVQVKFIMASAFQGLQEIKNPPWMIFNSKMGYCTIHRALIMCFFPNHTQQLWVMGSITPFCRGFRKCPQLASTTATQPAPRDNFSGFSPAEKASMHSPCMWQPGWEEPPNQTCLSSARFGAVPPPHFSSSCLAGISLLSTFYSARFICQVPF